MGRQEVSEVLAVAEPVAIRCPWAKGDLMIAYHDHEWGRPVHEDIRLFELLILEGAQAGLSWQCVLGKREAYRKAFAGFVPQVVAGFSAKKIERLMKNHGLIRNRLKLKSSVQNAKAFICLQKEFGSFDEWLWSYVDGLPRINRPHSPRDIPARTALSDRLSNDLRSRGFNFVGSTICYSFMQATGMVNDHLVGCHCHPINL
ncbi:MAG: DNA-3-methyladenine glycosylase I [Phycisphaerales bacterium]|nr:DNA-3-methyladenine glycosylase I [Phycisphaerales bacterium]